MKKDLLLKILAGFLCFFVIIVLVFCIPLIVNFSYKANGNFITMWNASDVLDYYGTILGAFVSVCVLAVTIYFNRQQLVIERRIQRDEEQLHNVEEIFNQAINDMHPHNMQVIFAEAFKSSNNSQLISGLFLYESTAKKSIDKLSSVVNAKDYNKLKELLEEMQIILRECIEFKNEYLSLIKDYTIEQMAIQYMQNTGSEQNMIIMSQFETLKKTNAKTEEISKKLDELYRNKFCPLITKKTEIFVAIYQDILKSK